MVAQFRNLQPVDRDAYEKVFMDGIDVPEDGNTFYNLPFHVNKQAKRPHEDAILRNGEFLSDSIHLALSNGIELQIQRTFKEPMGKALYLELTKVAKFAEIHKHVRHYTLTVEDMESMPAEVHKAIDKIFGTSVERPYSDNIVTTKATIINAAVEDLKKIPKWLEASPEILNDSRLGTLKPNEVQNLYWDRRKDKKYVPDTCETQDGSAIQSETRTVLFSNGVGVRLRRVFNEPLLEPTYAEFRKKQKRTILREDAADHTGDLFEEKEPRSLLRTVDRFQLYPVFLLRPEFADNERKKNPLYPLVPATRMQNIDRETADEATWILASAFNASTGQTPVYWTADRVALALAMRDLGNMHLHKAAFPHKEFFQIAHEVRQTVPALDKVS